MTCTLAYSAADEGAAVAEVVANLLEGEARVEQVLRCRPAGLPPDVTRWLRASPLTDALPENRDPTDVGVPSPRSSLRRLFEQIQDTQPRQHTTDGNLTLYRLCRATRSAIVRRLGPSWTYPASSSRNGSFST